MNFLKKINELFKDIKQNEVGDNEQNEVKDIKVNYKILSNNVTESIAKNLGMRIRNFVSDENL